MSRDNFYNSKLKRPLDVIGAVAGLVLTAPITIPTMVALAFKNEPENVFYTEPRLGKDGKPFDIYKFRTIYQPGNMDIQVEAGPFARFLRAHSIDELPQLVNIVKGDMSFIGPRP